MPKEIIFKGCATALVTPFCENMVDYQSFEKLIDFQIANKTDALVVCGTTGEGSTLKDYEKIMLFDSACKTVKGRIPVIAGTGSNDTTHAIYLSKEAEKIGVDALLIVTPYYNKCTQSGLIKHFAKIAESVNIPIIIYNVPSRTGFDITSDTYKQLSEIPNIVAVKEASGNISKIAEISSICGNDLNIYSGNDDLCTSVLSVGGLGVISVASNVIPFQMHHIFDLFFKKHIKECISVQIRLLKLIKALFCEVNPIPVKYALSLMGMCLPDTRAPLYSLSDENKDMLKSVLCEYSLI